MTTISSVHWLICDSPALKGGENEANTLMVSLNCNFPAHARGVPGGDSHESVEPNIKTADYVAVDDLSMATCDRSTVLIFTRGQLQTPMASSINEISYGNPIWKSNSVAAMSEARSRIEVAKNTDWNGQPPALYYYDLNALEALPEELAELPSLEQLHFYTDEHGKRKLRGEHHLADCSALRSLHDIQVLELWETNISDLSPLAHLTGLAELCICGTRITELCALSGLHRLRTLNVSITAIDDLGPLSALGNLEELYASRTSVSDLTPLSKLSKLTTLFVNHTNITDVSALSGLSGLTTLNINNTAVEDLTSLLDLRNLSDLDLSNCPIVDLSPISKLPNLSTIDITGVPSQN